MKDELGTAGATVGAIVLACLFGGLALAIYPGWNAIAECLSENFQPKAPEWIQAIGSLIGLGIAIYVPWKDRSNATRDERLKAKNNCDITIRFHSEVFVSNEGLLRVAINNLPKAQTGTRPDSAGEVVNAIRSIRAVKFDQIRIIAEHDADLAKHLADFHCELDFLTGVLDRNDEYVVENHAETIKFRLDRLNALAAEIRDRTV